MTHEKLKALLDNHVSLPFPSHPDNDELSNWIIDLAELDGFYIGIALSALNAKKIKCVDLSDIEKVKNNLQNIFVTTENDKKIAQACKVYVASIEKIIHEINKICGSENA